MDLVVVFIVSSFREVPGWCPAKKSSSNIRPGRAGRRAAPDQGMDAGANPASFFTIFSPFILTALASRNTSAYAASAASKTKKAPLSGAFFVSFCFMRPGRAP